MMENIVKLLMNMTDDSVTELLKKAVNSIPGDKKYRMVEWHDYPIYRIFKVLIQEENEDGVFMVKIDYDQLKGFINPPCYNN